jgi:hypothetical protein
MFTILKVAAPAVRKGVSNRPLGAPRQPGESGPGHEFKLLVELSNWHGSVTTISIEAERGVIVASKRFNQHSTQLNGPGLSGQIRNRPRK